MARFWFATFEAAQPNGSGLAIEVFENGREYAVLFCTVDNPNKPAKVTCLVGFANGAHSCAVWCDRGFPLVDAVIKRQNDRIQVSAACFLNLAAAIAYEAEVASIIGIAPEDASGRTERLVLSYEQSLMTPHSVFPATWLTQQQISWTRPRSSVKRRKPTPLAIDLGDPRYPKLKPFESGQRTPVAFWSGTIDLAQGNNPPARGSQEKVSLPGATIGGRKLARRDETFGVPVFRFEDVEVLGFRIDLSRHGTGNNSGLLDLCKRLNFHLDTPPGGQPQTTGSAISDFRYRPASRTVMLELLRYGKMKLRQPSPPFQLADYQSQHELLVRMLVGRVDDDTAQARDAATFVPAIFVDNPWSKVLGRSGLGFDKRMANFCVSREGLPTPLRPDGRLGRDGDPIPLGSIEEIRLATSAEPVAGGPPLLKLQCLCDAYNGWNDFDNIDLELAYAPFSLTPTRWQQSDFDEREFRRSFARSAITRTIRGFRSIQVSPVGPRPLRETLAGETTWITGTVDVDRGAQIARPDGIVRLTMCAPPEGPAAWTGFCNLLGGDDTHEVSISLPPGSWYRMRCSMDLTIDDGV